MEKKSEKKVQNEIFFKIGSRSDCRIFRNTRGLGFVGKKVSEYRKNGKKYTVSQDCRRNEFGLFPGASDLIGWKTVEITPDMVGQKIAVFTSIECKRPGNNKKPFHQKKWINNINKSGGFSGFASSVDDALKIVDKKKDPEKPGLKN